MYNFHIWFRELQYSGILDMLLSHYPEQSVDINCLYVWVHLRERLSFDKEHSYFQFMHFLWEGYVCLHV